MGSYGSPIHSQHWSKTRDSSNLIFDAADGIRLSGISYELTNVFSIYIACFLSLVTSNFSQAIAVLHSH